MHATGIFCLLALSVERHHHLHTLICSVSTFTVAFIHTMEDDQRLNTLVHKGDALHFMLQQCCKKTENPCTFTIILSSSQDYFSCDHLPLFELGSVHYDHYLINLRFPSLPLGHKKDHEGLLPIDKLSLFVSTAIVTILSASLPLRRFIRHETSLNTGSSSKL